MAINVYSLFRQAPIGLSVTADGSSNLTLGMQFSLSQPAGLTGIWFFSPSGGTTIPSQCGVFSVSGQNLIVANNNPTWSGTAGAGWIKCQFDGQFVLESNTSYIAAVYTPTPAAFYAATASYWTTGLGTAGLTVGIITAPNNGAASVGQDSFANHANLTYPTTSGSGNNYWFDVEVATGLPTVNPPVAGFTTTAPRTWSTGDQVTTPRLRASIYNAAALATQGRPEYVMVNQINVANNLLTLIDRVNPLLNTWQIMPTQTAGTAQQYIPPLPGWYLLEASGSGFPLSGGASNTQFSWGFWWQAGTAVIPSASVFGTTTGITAGTTPARVGQSMADLQLFNPASNDLISAYYFNTNSGGGGHHLHMGIEWVGLPSTGTVNGVAYTGPVGQVVTSPKPASLWPPTGGATLQGSVSASGTVVVLPPVPGMRAGQAIGLDWQNGQQNVVTAEVGTISAIAGGTVTLSSGLSYGHNAGAAVAVPVSAAFLNEQLRDAVNFQFYPPMLRAVQGTASAQSITNNTWTTINLALSGTGITGLTNTIDNFSGWATITSNSYTIPVSGVYDVIGQALFNGSTAQTTWGVRLIDNNGVTYSGDFYASHSSSVVAQGPAVRRLLRLTAGQTIALQCIQTSGVSVSLQSLYTPDNAFNVNQLDQSKLIVIFRTF